MLNKFISIFLVSLKPFKSKIFSITRCPTKVYEKQRARAFKEIPKRRSAVKNTTHNLIFQVFICEVVRSVEKVKEGRKKIIV